MTDRQKKRAKPGPRPRGPFADKRKTLTTRITERTRRRIEEAAKETDRSLSQEIEFRLERSISEEDYLSFLYDDPHMAGFVREFLDAKRLIEAHLEKSVWEDLESHEAMKSALRRLLKQNAPSPSSNLKKKIAAYKRYAERKLKPWRERGGILGLLSPLSNPDAGPAPTLKASPVDHARAVGRAAADVVHKDHQAKALKALVEVLMATPHEED